MLPKARSSLWAISLIFTASLIQEAYTDGFIYPAVNSVSDFHVMDRVNVSWTSSFSKPSLQLYCGNKNNPPLVNRSVYESGSYQLDLRRGWVYPDCYLQLTQGSNYFSTTRFQIQRRSSSGVRRIWSAPNQAQAPPSVSANATGPGSPAGNDTSTTKPTGRVKQRPPITLNSDGPDSQYVWNEIDCLDNSDLFYPGCWQVLNITSWLPKWFLETPVCQPGESEADCNVKNPGETPEPWTQTFLREAVGGSSGDCTIIGGNLCAYYFNSDDGSGDTPLERARFRYVRYNIYMISGFFNSWYTAINTAMQEASLSIDGIIRLVDPTKKTHVGLNAFLTVLGIGLGFLPAVGPEIEGISSLAISAANIALDGIKAAPGIAQQIWPKGTQDSQTTQIDELQSDVPQVLSQLQSNLEHGLKAVQGVNQSDVSSFLAFTGNGNFSTSPGSAPTVIASTGTAIQPLLLAFTTYLVSTALSQNGWHALLLPGVNPMGYTNGSSGCPSWASGCHGDNDLHCSGYDAHGQCNGTYWWYSAKHNSAYTLNHADKTSSTDIIHSIFANSWSTGSLLFESAAVCELQAALQAANSSLNYTSVGGNAGFSFANGAIPDLDPGDVVQVNATTTFLPINGGGLSHLSTIPVFADLLFHPNDTFWKFDADGLDFSCTSQLNVSVANSWGGSWTANSP